MSFEFKQTCDEAVAAAAHWNEYFQSRDKNVDSVCVQQYACNLFQCLHIPLERCSEAMQRTVGIRQ